MQGEDMSGLPAGPWRWSAHQCLTSRGSDSLEGDVICPEVAPDGHPGIAVSDEVMAAIAAIPDTHAALKRARDMLQAVAGDIEDGYSLDGLRGKYVLAIMASRDDADAALAKAKGSP